MKKWEVNRRKIVCIGVLATIASLGIFAGTYAKYVSELSLTDGEDTDQSARVAIWNVGQVASINVKLFSSYYYGNITGQEINGDYANSGHNVADTSNDTVFTNTNGKNIVAPGTHGYKTIGISNAAVGSGRPPVTEVTYKLIQGTAPSATITHDLTENVFNGQLRFAVLTDAGIHQIGDITDMPVVDWENDTYKKSIGEDSIAIPWKSVTDALADMYTNDNATNLGNVKEVKNIVVLWKWDFENSATASNDEKDTALGMATELPTISINFGTMRAEQVD
ncbi:MAG: hypothetical protein LBS33_01865 [Streptococcaceae bacterium]|nr:hypothetical protein [Streptococcaceae bacterium]